MIIWIRSLQMKVIKTVNLKKYDNRKLYAPVGELSDQGHYVTLKDVAQVIREGNKVQISDKGGNDVTNEVLTQVVASMKLSNGTLVKLIRG